VQRVGDRLRQHSVVERDILIDRSMINDSKRDRASAASFSAFSARLVAFFRASSEASLSTRSPPTELVIVDAAIMMRRS
jgi:hypothetical protein